MVTFLRFFLILRTNILDESGSYRGILIALFIILSLNFAYAQTDYHWKVSEAHGYYYTEEFDEALSSFKKAFKLSSPKPRDLLVASYAAAIREEEQLALTYLEKYFLKNQHVYLDLASIIDNPAFADLSKSDKWKNITRNAMGNNMRLEKELDNDLRIALEQLYEKDQNTRNNPRLDSLIEVHGFPSEPVSALFKKMKQQDMINLAEFRKLVPPDKFPGVNQVGVKANLSAWLIIQHSSTLVQKEYMDALKKSATLGETDWTLVAKTIDRIMVEEEGVQLYGTQFGLDESGNGYVKPIKDPQYVNQRRADMGLIALEHDLKRHGIKLD